MTTAPADPGPTEVETRIVLRPIVSGAPLAFFAFGVGTILFSSSELQWAPVSEQHTLAILLVVFVAPLEVLAGLLAVAGRDTGLATTTTLFGAVWGAIGFSMLDAPPGSRSVIVGIFLLTASAMLVLLATAAVFGKPMLLSLLAVALARFVFSGVYEVTGSTGFEHTAGWLGIPIVIISMYGGLAFLLEDSLHRTVLPIGRRSEAKAAIDGDMASQVRSVHHEAGVRAQL